MDARHVVEGPGEVGLAFSLAGVGPRFAAAVLDTVLVVIGILVLALGLGAMGFSTSLSLPIIMSSLLLGLAYFSVFEARRGRTPGKAALGLRVIDERGDHVSPRQALVRNILRIVDFMPAAYLVGSAVMSLDGRQRRLGDLVAGTIVVKEGRTIDPLLLKLRVPYRQKATHPLEVLERVALTPEEYQALRAFCFRTRTLPRARREALALEILAPLYARAGRRIPGAVYVEELLVDLMHHLNGTFGVKVHPDSPGRRPRVGPPDAVPPDAFVKHIRRSLDPERGPAPAP